MRWRKFTQEPIVGSLKQAWAGLAMAEICGRSSFSEATLRRWRAKFSSIDASEARRLRELEAEKPTLKHLLAEVQLDLHALKSVLGVKNSPHRPGPR